MKPNLLIAALMTSVLVSACANLERSRDLANPAVPGKVLAQQVCALCHGIDGNSVSPAFPQLAGQQSVYLVNQMNNFRAHQRTDPAGSEYMWGLSHHLSDEQISALADYYAHQIARRPTAASASPELLAAGKEIFEKGVPEQNVIACAACHGPQAQGVDAFPHLAYQHSDYLKKQLDIFQNTQGRPGTPMETVVHPLTGANKDAVAAYLQALPE